MSRKLVQDDKELLLISQIELKKLQRQYRIMEGDKNSYASEIKCYLNKQRKIIETLEKEENGLLSKLRAEKPLSVSEYDTEWNRQFNELLKTFEKYVFLIKQKKDTIAKLETKIKNFQNESKILLYYGDSKTIQMDENIGKANKQLHLLQNKLHNVSFPKGHHLAFFFQLTVYFHAFIQETIKYDKALAENLAIRQEVDALLKGRSRFNDIYKKLVIKLNADKKKLLALMEQATIACEQRDAADDKLKTTINKDQQEIITQKHKMRELYRQLDHYMQLKEFLSIKGQKRILADLEQKENAKKQQKIEQIEKYTQKHNSILEQIKEFCGEHNTERLPAIFLKQEEENFALFNYVNEINNEMELLQDEMAVLNRALEEQRMISTSIKKECSESMESFRKELVVKKEKIEDEKKRLTSVNSILEIMFKEMENLFSLFKRDSPSLIHLIGENQISSHNADLFLQIMDKKVEDFLCDYNCST
ncbi:coiled-coil domain-containing protein 63 isoform X1 [Planococcus citri]|uniref:coiled-coil domain-containing protein 63 isoform X1 n=1 Tax=Planococcus citri TaxID=170843 RepID=UPI0031F83A62